MGTEAESSNSGDAAMDRGLPSSTKVAQTRVRALITRLEQERGLTVTTADELRAWW